MAKAQTLNITSEDFVLAYDLRLGSSGQRNDSKNIVAMTKVLDVDRSRSQGVPNPCLPYFVITRHT